jgi:damage-control phosphatase, subfamily I
LRMSSNCYACILDRAKFEGDLVFKTEAEKTRAMEELLDFMAGHKGGVPALVGTQREIIIKQRSKKADPYHNLKAEANEVAAALVPVAEQFYSESKDKLEALIRIAAAANSMEFGVKGHNFENATFGQIFDDILGENLKGDLDEIRKLLDIFVNVLYLTDNSGEVIFDLFVIEELKRMGKRVVIASKSEPILNDVTADELRSLTDNEVIPAGPVVGTWLDKITPELSTLLFDKDWLIISKGMGNFETMSEYDSRLAGRLIYILRAKCEPVAAALGVAKGSLVAKTI